MIKNNLTSDSRSAVVVVPIHQRRDKTNKDTIMKFQDLISFVSNAIVKTRLFNIGFQRRRKGRVKTYFLNMSKVNTNIHVYPNRHANLNLTKHG